MSVLRISTPLLGDDFGSAIWVDAQARIYLVGISRPGLGNASQFGVVRYLGNGQLDTSFSSDGWLTTAFPNKGDAAAYGVAMSANGGITVAGTVFNQDTGFVELAVARYLESGAADTTFGQSGLLSFAIPEWRGRSNASYDVAALSDGRLLLSGYAMNSNGGVDFLVVRLQANGQLDSSFGSNGYRLLNLGQIDQINDLEVLPDGRILLAGYTRSSAGATNMAIGRISAEGELDTGFGSAGWLTLDLSSTALGWSGQDDIATAIRFDPTTGTYLVAGYSSNFTGFSHAALLRVLSTGQLDTTFGDAGVVLTQQSGGTERANDLLVLPSGRILVAGSASGDMALFSFLSNGAFDTSQSSNGLIQTDFSSTNESGGDVANAIALSNGQVVLAGNLLERPEF